MPQEMTREVLKLKEDPETAKRNHCGILLATDATAGSTKTLSHVLWALCTCVSQQRPRLRWCMLAFRTHARSTGMLAAGRDMRAE